MDEHTTSELTQEGGHSAGLPTAGIQEASPVAGGVAFERQVSAEAWRRYRIVHQVAQLRADGTTQAEACSLVGVDQATLWRWMNRVGDVDVLDASLRDQVLAFLEPGHSTGRPSEYSAMLDLEHVRAKLQTLYLATVGSSSESAGADRRSAKAATALLRFAEEPECPPELAIRLRRGYCPVSFVRFLRQITPELEQRVRGTKHYTLNGLVSRRDMTLRTPDGNRAEMPAGWMIELDDMSMNQPFYVDGPDGVILSRQGLYARDVRSGRWIGVELIARPREAYRAEDILRFLRRLMQQYGKFPMLRLEQGVWKSRAIAGVRVTETGSVQEDLVQRPGMTDDERHRLQDGLSAIGIEIQYATSAHRKGGIEGGFNFLQTIAATYSSDWQNIGRHPGEFEHGARQLRRVRSGSHHPANVGFAPIDAAAAVIERSFIFCNAKVNQRTHHSPDDVWTRDLAAHPLPELTERDLAVFLPDVREVQIRGGAVSVTVDGVPHDFRADRLIELGTGYRVYVRFDSTEPSLGAAIYNRETSSANFSGHGVGDLICHAAYEVPGPQANVESCNLPARSVQDIYGPGAEDTRNDMRKSQSRIVRTAFRALPRPGQPAVRTATARDGRGRVTEATTEQPGVSNRIESQSPLSTDRRGAVVFADEETISVACREDRPAPQEETVTVQRARPIAEALETFDEEHVEL